MRSGHVLVAPLPVPGPYRAHLTGEKVAVPILTVVDPYCLVVPQDQVNPAAISQDPALVSAFSPHKHRTNLLDNGAHVINQRVSALTGITTDAGQKVVDRWAIRNGGLGTYTLSQLAAGPANTEFVLCSKLLCTTADAAPAAGDYLLFGQSIEGFNLQHLLWGTPLARAVTCSFWINMNTIGTFVVELFRSEGASNRCISATFTVNAANTWEYKTVTFPGDTTTAITNDSAARLSLAIWLGGGTTYTSGTLGTSWAAQTNANRAVGCSNLSATINNFAQVTGCQLEVGSFASAFATVPFAQELINCMRYYQKSYPYANAPGSVNAAGMTPTYCKVFDTTVLTRLAIYQAQFIVPMRGVPVVSAWSSDGTAGDINAYNAAATKLVISSFNDISERSVSGWLTTTANATADTMYQFHWAATADI